MRQSICGMLIGAAALIASSSFALAGEQTLEFKLVVKTLDPLVLQAANVEGQTMTATKAFGVALFKDGRVAVKDFIGSSETRNGSGPMHCKLCRGIQRWQSARRLHDLVRYRHLRQRHRDGQLRKRSGEIQGGRSHGRKICYKNAGVVKPHLLGRVA